MSGAGEQTHFWIPEKVQAGIKELAKHRDMFIQDLLLLEVQDLLEGRRHCKPMPIKRGTRDPSWVQFQVRLPVSLKRELEIRCVQSEPKTSVSAMLRGLLDSLVREENEPDIRSK